MAIETDINKALLDDIYAIYSQAETEMLEKVAKRVAKGITTEGWNERKLSEVQKLKKDIEKTISSKCYEGQGLISEDIISAYTKGKISAAMEAGTKAKKSSSIDMSGITSKKLKESIQTAFDYAKGMDGLPQDPDNMFKKVVYATGAKEKMMLKTGAGAEVVGDTIIVCKPLQKYIDDDFIMHEIGHKVTKFGSKTTHSSQAKAAEELAKKLGYSSVKSMSAYVSSYATKNPAEFYPEALMEYYHSLKTGKPLTGNKKKIIEAAMEQMYNDPSKKKAIRKDAIKFAKGVHTTVLDDLDIPMNLKQLVLATNKLLNNASFQILRNAEDAYTQIMSNATTGLLAGTDTRIQASQKMLNEMAMKGITSFVDKSGRSWNLSSYAEMCARTVSSHAALQGHIDRQLEVGEDLVKVSAIGTTCPICQRWQGVVLSISGKSPKYHSIDEAKASGLFHPNCKHTLGMFIPELDGEGKVEPAPLDMNTQSSKRNKLIEKQRANERNIRYWKNRAAVAVTDKEKSKCNEKIKYWQYTNLLHCQKNGLRRQYAREKVYTGNAKGPVGAPIGGHLKEYEDMYKDVIGSDPKKVFKESKKVYGSKEVTFEKWLRDEITSLDQLDIDKAQMKDSSKKSVTPTSLYKKYIGDNPAADWAEVSPFEKGTKEYKTGYAKWLKEQIEEIGVSYKIKPKYTEVHEDIPVEDTKLSATELYKKYHGGKKPTEAFREAGGEEGTGMKYGKWVETEKKKLIKEGIKKTVPFDSSVRAETAKTIKEATESVKKAKEFVDEPEIKKFKEKASEISDPKAMSVEMRLVSEKISKSKGREKELLEKEYEILKERDLEILRGVVKKAKPGTGVGGIDFEMKWLKEHVLDKKSISDDVKAHVKKKYDIWAERKKEADAEEAEKKRKKEEKEAREREIRFMLKDIRDKAETMTNAELEAMKLDFDDDDSKKRKVDVVNDIIKEREAAKIRKEASEKRKAEIEKLVSKGGYIPRDTGASVLDDITEFYNNSSVKKSADKSIKKMAKEFSMTEKETKEMLDNDLKAIFQECEFGARIRGSVLEKVLSDDPDEGGFKNLFEVGTGGGCTNKNSRSRGENKVFGYKDDNENWENNKHDRPFYGMMMPKYEEEKYTSKDYYKNGPGKWYGDGITLTFDKAIASNVSFTLGDSLDYSDSVIGCEAINPEFRGGHYDFDTYYPLAKKGFSDEVHDVDPNLLLVKIAKEGDTYLELQYHGHQTKNDMVNFIKHVYIDKDRYYDVDKITKLLDKKGIDYSVI